MRGTFEDFERKELIAVASVNVVGRVVELLHVTIVHVISL